MENPYLKNVGHHQNQSFNVTVVLLALILVFGIIGWRYVDAINQKNQTEQQIANQEHQDAVNKAALEENAKALQQQASQQAESDKQNAIDSCLSDAQQAYIREWNSDCTIEHDAVEGEYQSCLNGSYSVAGSPYAGQTTPFACRQQFPVFPTSGCKLGMNGLYYKTVTAQLQQAKDDCYKRYK